MSLFKPNGKYRAYIVVDGKQIHLGYFFTKEEASISYEIAKEKYHKI